MTPTQADREDAAALYEAFPAFSSSHDAAMKTAQFIRDGGGDGWNTVQAFTRHRLAAEAAAFEKAAGVAETIAADWRAKVSGYRQAGNDGPYLGEPTGDDIATAIRKLAGEKYD